MQKKTLNAYSCIAWNHSSLMCYGKLKEELLNTNVALRSRHFLYSAPGSKRIFFLKSCALYAAATEAYITNYIHVHYFPQNNHTIYSSSKNQSIILHSYFTCGLSLRRSRVWCVLPVEEETAFKDFRGNPPIYGG